MGYTIFLEGMTFKGYHGVLPEERSRGQRFLVDVELLVEDSFWPEKDDLQEVVDYASVYATVKEVVEGEAVNLLETLGEKLVTALFLRFPVEEIALCIQKPEAPLGEGKGRAGVRLKRQRGEWQQKKEQEKQSWTLAYVGMGSNLGDRQAFLWQALGLLAVHPQVRLEKVSSFYETQPVGVAGQELFLNAVAEISTALSAERLLALLLKIEEKLGRRRPYPGAPRTIDLDLLLYGEERIELPDLIVPHPRLLERDFMLVPLLEIAPVVRLPGGISAREILAELRKRGSNLLSKFPGHVTI